MSFKQHPAEWAKSADAGSVGRATSEFFGEAEYSPFSAPDLAVAPLDLHQRLHAPVPLLDREASAAACRWNQRTHPTVSGVDPEHIRTDLARYVNFAHVQRL
ncbi:MAG TPA: hypothetical protein VF541_12200, partial [Longimicrobium sp.]